MFLMHFLILSFIIFMLTSLQRLRYIKKEEDYFGRNKQHFSFSRLWQKRYTLLFVPSHSFSRLNKPSNTHWPPSFCLQKGKKGHHFNLILATNFYACKLGTNMQKSILTSSSFYYISCQEMKPYTLFFLL